MQIIIHDNFLKEILGYMSGWAMGGIALTENYNKTSETVNTILPVMP